MLQSLQNSFVLVAALSVVTSAAASCTGCIELDEITFDKIVKKFQYTLVKFDLAFPYGEKHEAYSDFARKIGPTVDDLVVTLVGVKDYGEKENSALAERFNVRETKFPVILLFSNYSSKAWKQYPEDKSITSDNIKHFVKDQTDLYIGLDGCLRELDELASSFADSASNKQQELINAAKEWQEKYDTDKERERAKIYVIIMKKIAEKGVAFIKEEQKRLENLIQGKISDNKKLELSRRLNILQSFQYQTLKASKNDEL